MVRKRDKGYGQYDFSSRGVINDFNTDMRYVSNDLPRKRSRFGGRGINININSPRHIITEDYRDYHNRTRIKKEMNESVLIFLMGFVFIIIGVAIFKSQFGYSVVSIVFGIFLVYMGFKYNSRKSREYRNHFRG